MAYLTPEQLRAAGFKAVGRNVKISDRAAIYDAARIEIGDHTRIDDFCVISGRVVLGRNVHLAVFCHVGGGSEGVFIGDFSGMAYGAQAFSQSDDYTGVGMTNPTIPARYKKETKAAVHLGRHCIVGAGSIVLPGVHLADGTSVGALSLVTKSTQEWSIYFGAPARRLRSRQRAPLDLERDYLASGE